MTPEKFQERRTANLEDLFANLNSQLLSDQRRRKSLHDPETASSDTDSGFLTWLRRKVAVQQDEGGSHNPNLVYNSYGMYVGNRSKQNRREAEIESLQADIEDFEGSRKIILDDLLTGRNTHGLEWAWYCCKCGVGQPFALGVEDALLVSGVKTICAMRRCLHVHCPDCRLIVEHRVLGSIAELPPLEPVGSELHIPDILVIPSTGSPLLLLPLPLLFTMAELRDERTGRSESPKHETFYHR